MTGVLLRIFMIIVGLIIFGVATVSLAKKHMTEVFCIFWGIISVLFILAGIILQPNDWNRYISWSGLIIMCFGIICVLVAGFFFSVRISRLMRQVTELAVLVSLLNQENELLIKETAKFNEEYENAESERHEHEEENLIHN